jgi:hypothetical protein
VTIENLLKRFRHSGYSNSAVTHVTAVQPYSRATSGCNGSETGVVTAVTESQCVPGNVTPVTEAKRQTLQREALNGAACTAVTAVTSKIEDAQSEAATTWLATVAAHMGTTANVLFASDVFLPDEVADYLDRDPVEVAEAIRPTWSKRFQVFAPIPDDDRRYCWQCANLTRAGTCLAATRGELGTSRNYQPIDWPPRRCASYVPTSDDADQRHGRDRWPWMMKTQETEK